VTAALEAAIVADPNNPALRVHLASLLVMSGDAGRALEHAQAALQTAPDDAEALVAARDAARALGDTARADSYARILRSFEGTTPPPFEPEDPVPGFGPRWAEAEEPEEPIAKKKSKDAAS
jgi:Flp pilus assembly protein TadD